MMTARILVAVIGAVASVALIAAVGTAQADPIDVNYTVSGSPGAWVVDLSVTNNLGGANYVYFFDIQLPSTNELNSPPNWGYNPGDNPWNHAPSGTIYNNPWCLGSCFGTTSFSVGINPGQTLSGFQALDTDFAQPMSLLWMAYSFSYVGKYDGPGCFNCGANPGFEGAAQDPNAVPLPAALPLFASGLGALGLLGWRRKRKIAV